MDANDLKMHIYTQLLTENSCRIAKSAGTFTV